MRYLVEIESAQETAGVQKQLPAKHRTCMKGRDPPTP